MNQAYVEELGARARESSVRIEGLLGEIRKVIVGQDRLLRSLIVALLTEGHVLLEGVPGLAKTLAVRTLASALHAQFHRIQFTPDLLPSDLIGSLVFNQNTTEFSVRKGPVFTNLLLADEVNRAPAKVQSALLEAMQERQVTIGDQTMKLPDPFVVLATQNPIEQEGTYPLPEAQIDRFMLKTIVTYPARADEITIVQRMTGTEMPAAEPIEDLPFVGYCRDLVRRVYVDERIIGYIVDLVSATRSLRPNGEDGVELVEYGASPRAAIWLTNAAKALAFLNGRGYVVPIDVKDMAKDVLRHRIIVTYEGEAEGVTSEQVIDHAFATVKVP